MHITYVFSLLTYSFGYGAAHTSPRWSGSPKFRRHGLIPFRRAQPVSPDDRLRSPRYHQSELNLSCDD